jgi:predicted kinase
VTRLIHLNGPPGIGKSTLSRRYVRDHVGVLNCDIDVLRSLIGGWSADFVAAGALIRPAALAMIEAYLRSGHDVVLPQMLLDPAERRRFRETSENAGAAFVERFLMDESGANLERFARRGTASAADPWHDQVRAIVAEQGGDTALERWHDDLVALLATNPDAQVIWSVEGAEDDTYARLVASLA